MNRKIIIVDGEEYLVRWRGLFDVPGARTKGWCYTGTVGKYRVPHLHRTPEDLQFCAFECAKCGKEWMEKNMGKPVDIEAFIKA